MRSGLSNGCMRAGYYKHDRGRGHPKKGRYIDRIRDVMSPGTRGRQVGVAAEDVGQRLVDHLLDDLALFADDASEVHQGDGQIADDSVVHVDLIVGSGADWERVTGRLG